MYPPMGGEGGFTSGWEEYGQKRPVHVRTTSHQYVRPMLGRGMVLGSTLPPMLEHGKIDFFLLSVCHYPQPAAALLLNMKFAHINPTPAKLNHRFLYFFLYVGNGKAHP